MSSSYRCSSSSRKISKLHKKPPPFRSAQTYSLSSSIPSTHSEIIIHTKKMGSNPTSDRFELLLGILCLVGVIYISPSIIAAYFYLAKPLRTDLENTEEGEMKFEEAEMKFEEIEKVKDIEEAENFEEVRKVEVVQNFNEVESFEEVESLEDVENPEELENSGEFKKFDDDGEMIEERRPREEVYTSVPIRAKDDEWEIV